MAQKKTEQMGSRDRFKASVRSGDAFAGKGEWEKAINHYIEALSFDEKAKEVHEKLLKMYLNKGDKKGYTEALARLNAIKSGKPLPEQKSISEKKPPNKFQELELIEEPIQSKAKEDIKEDIYPESSSVIQKLPEEPIQEELHEQQEDLPQELIREEQHDVTHTSEELAEEQFDPVLQESPQILLKKQLQDDAAQVQLQDELESIIQGTQQEHMQQDLLQETNPKPIVEPDKNRSEKIEANDVSVAKTSFSSPSDEARVLEETLLQEPDNLEVLEQLNQLYSKGVKLSDSAVVAIYRKIYRMKI